MKIFIFLEMTSRAATMLSIHISKNVQSFRYRSYIGTFTGCVGQDCDRHGCLKENMEIYLTFDKGTQGAAVGGR